MKLDQRDITENRSEWLEKGYHLPGFDRERVVAETAARPEWVHFGGGNIFRAFIAALVQELLEQGIMDRGVIVAVGHDYRIIDIAYRPFDSLCLSVTLKSEGVIEKTVVGSVTEALRMDPWDPDFARLREIFACPSLRLASFTVTEKGYRLRGPDGQLLEEIRADLAAGPGRAASYMGKISALLYHRFEAGALPLALVSMDNISHNGSRLREAVGAFAAGWEERGLAEKGFSAYVNDPAKVGFPWTMIDKITPRPDARVLDIIRADGLQDMDSVKTEKGSFVAPFVNAEETQYLVMEDWFPNGRPDLGRGRGVVLTDRETVDKVERMKVCTCLNPLHTALAVFGCLLGYTLISEEMRDPDLKRLVEAVGYREGLPVVVDPGILDPREFIDTVVRVRFPNVFMPDSPQRIATDTSQKLAIRFGETVKAYMGREDLSVADLKAIPLVFAGWLRYVLGVDDRGRTFEPSDDPLLEEMQSALRGVRLGDGGPFSERLRPILSNDRLFGVDLYRAGLGERVEAYFAELVSGPGAVREALRKYVQ
ncbi:MAG: mannitol dehydrogenase family protein [Clostridia bacterium]|nr:mannitol dehydrogenase family protein [Clostridia bacterium]